MFLFQNELEKLVFEIHTTCERFFFSSLSRCCSVGESNLDEKFRTELESFWSHVKIGTLYSEWDLMKMEKR